MAINYWQKSSGDYQASPWSQFYSGGGARTTLQDTSSTKFAVEPEAAAMVPSAQQQTPQTSAAQPATEQKWGLQPDGSVLVNWNGTQPQTQQQQMPTQDWYDFGIKDAANGGSILAPRISVNDLRYQEGSYSGDGGGWNQEQYGIASGGSGAFGTGNYGMWNNLGNTGTNFEMSNWAPGGSGFNVRIKSADKEASNLRYEKQGDYYVPVEYGGKSYWDTNDSKQNIAIAKTIATAVSMGMAGPALQGLSSALSAGAMPTLSQIGAGLNLVNTASGGQIPGLREAGIATGFAGNVSNLTDSISNGINSFSDAAKLGQNALGAFTKGSSLMNMFAGAGQQQPQPNQTYQKAVMPFVAPTTQQGTGTPNQFSGTATEGSFLGNLFGSLPAIGAGIYGDARNRDAFQGLNDMASRAEQERQFYQNQLKDSYTNPDSFYNSNEFKGLNSVYQNSIDRDAAKQGRLANPTDREVLLQAHAMKQMENYRNGLRGGLQANPLQAEALAKAMQYKAQSGAQTAAGFNYGGAGSLLQNLLRGAGGQGGAVSPQSLAQLIQGAYGLSGAFGGMNPGMGGAIGNFDANYGVESPGSAWDAIGGTGQDYSGGYQASPFAGYNDLESGGWGDMTAPSNTFMDDPWGAFDVSTSSWDDVLSNVDGLLNW